MAPSPAMKSLLTCAFAFALAFLQDTPAPEPRFI